MSPSLDVQCKALRGGESQSWESLAPNPDISGIGVRSLPNAQIAKTLIFQVLIGFLTTAWVTLLLVTVYFLMGCVEKKLLNEIDRMVLTKISPRKRVRSVQHLELTLRRIVLMFSDQQVVTGIALLAGGYAQLSSGIDSYHRQMLVYLAWFSSLTHLTTLTVLRQYFQENHNARLWRSVLMLITVILLGAALLPTGDILWLEADQSVTILAPALCYFRRLGSRIFDDRFEVSSRTGVSMAISLVVLISGYITRIAKLSVKAGSSTRHYLRHIPSRSIRTIRGVVLKRLNEPAPGFRKIHWIVAYIALETSYIWVKAFFDVYESMVGEIIWLASALAWGTRNLFVTRSIAANIDENTWGFGQMFPVILLVLPMLSALETYYEKDLSDCHSDVLGGAVEPGPANNSSPPPSNQGNPHLAYYIGHWHPKTQPATFANFSITDDVRTVRRTGTDLQMEEQAVGGLHSRTSRTSAQSSPTTNNLNSSNGYALAGPMGGATTFDYYQLHWFWIVVLTILGGAVVMVTAVLSRVRNVIEAWTVLINPLLFLFCPSIVLTGGFLVLCRFHATVGQKVEKTLKIRREKQRELLRILAWCWFGVIMVYNILQPWLGPSFWL